jgi:hypothetical protein
MAFIKTAIVLTVGQVASSAISSRSANKRAKKAQEASEEAARKQALIEGSAPSISSAQQISEAAQLLAGSEVGQGLQGMAYEDPEGRDLEELIQDPAVQEQLFDQFGPSPELDALLEASSGLIDDGALAGMSSGVMAAARGGAVGRPKDVYYFSVPNIQKMMGDTDPGIQNVGQQMMGQIQANPEQGMVQASPQQLQMMARGGMVRPRRYEAGGPVIQADPEYASGGPQLLDSTQDAAAIELYLEHYLALQDGLITRDAFDDRTAQFSPEERAAAHQLLTMRETGLTPEEIVQEIAPRGSNDLPPLGTRSIEEINSVR